MIDRPPSGPTRTTAFEATSTPGGSKGRPVLTQTVPGSPTRRELLRVGDGLRGGELVCLVGGHWSPLQGKRGPRRGGEGGIRHFSKRARNASRKPCALMSRSQARANERISRTILSLTITHPGS